MAEVDDKPATKAPEHKAEAPSDEHKEDEHKSGTTNDRVENKSTDPVESSGKLLSEISKQDWQTLGLKEFARAAGSEARSILSGFGVEQKKTEAPQTALDKVFKFDFSGALDFSNWKNPFDSGHHVKDQGEMGFNMNSIGNTMRDFGAGVYTPDQIAAMGFNFPKADSSFGWDGHQGKRGGWDRFHGGWKDDGDSNRSGLSFGDTSIFNNLDVSRTGDVNLSSSLSTSFYDKLNTDSIAKTVTSGFSSVWNTISDWGGKAWDGVKTLGNAVIDFDFAGSKHETLTGRDGNVEVVTDRNGNKLIGTEKFNMTQSAGGKDDPKDASVSTKDGLHTIEHKADGTDVASSKNSDLVIHRNNQTGKVEALDKSGKPIATFDDKGDALRFFKNSVTEVVPAGTNLDTAYQQYMSNLDAEIKKDPAKAAMKDLPVLLMDGNGESLTVRPDGTKLYTHDGGKSEMIMPHMDAQTKESKPLEVRISKDANGNEHLTIGTQGGKQFELNSEEARRLMANSRFKLGPDGQLQVNDDSSGYPERGQWANVIDPANKHRLHIFHGGDIDLRTGVATINDGSVVAVLTPNHGDKGGVTDKEFKVQADGTVDKTPTQVITVDGKGNNTIEKIDPTTGQPIKDETVKMHMHPDGTSDVRIGDHTVMDRNSVSLLNPDGTKATIDGRGNIDMFDHEGNKTFSSDGDSVYYDGHKTYEQWLHSYNSEKAEDAINQATATAAIVDGMAAALAGSLNIDASQIDALEQLLAGVVGNLPPGIPLPPQVSAARASIAAARARDNQDNNVDRNTLAVAGVENPGLLKLAREAGTTDPFKAARYALKAEGYKVEDA